MRKKLLLLVLTVILSVSIMAACGNDNSSDESETQSDIQNYNDVPLKETSVESGTEGYYENLYDVELYNFRVIKNLITLYEEEQWNNYYLAGSLLAQMDTADISQSEEAIIEKAKEEREKLVQIKSYVDNAWFIWGDDMPCTINPESLVFTSTTEDNSDFAPFLLPYLLEDQSQVKGNIIIISGGGYTGRSNKIEGYPTATMLNTLGYNCFVLQRRVAPYSKQEIWMDLQRSIRYLRFNAESLSLGGIDCIAAVGFSGGSSTVLGTVANMYGEVQPINFDSSYTPDEVDEINSDLTVAIPVYGPVYDDNFDKYEGLVTENPNIPPMLIIAGQDDYSGAADDSLLLYSSVTGKTTVEMYIFAYNSHGFGPGKEGTNSEKWTNLAAAFIEEVVGNQ